MPARPSVYSTLALCVGDALGYSGPTSVPFWLGGVSAMYGLAPEQAGLLVTGELFAIALSAIVMSRLIGRVAPRVSGLCGAGLSIVGNLIAYASDSVAMLAAGLVAVGVGLGALLATCNVMAGRRADPQRTMALMQLALVIFAMLFFFFAPRAIGVAGPKIAFAILAGVGVAALPVLAGLPGRLEREAARSVGEGAIGPRMIAACIALLLLLGGQNCFWPFMQVLGQNAGFDPVTVGVVLSIGAVINLAGPIASGLIGPRFGFALPIVGGFALMMAASALLGQLATPFGFAVGSISLSTLTLFLAPYLLGLLAVLDSSGRMAGAGPALMMIGSAIAPAAAGATVGAAGFTGLSYLTMGVFGTALVLAGFAASGRGRQVVSA